MSGLLDQVQKKSTLSRGKKITTNLEINRQDIIKPQKEMDTNTIPANIRINQGLRNKIAALSIIGYGDSQKEVIEFLINSVLPTLSNDENKKINDLTGIYEKKDIQNYKKK